MLKYEQRFEGNKRRLIVKNITNNDLTQFSCEAKGEKSTAKLAKMSPWVEKLNNTEGPLGGIAVFEVRVPSSTHVNWYVGSTKITKNTFR